MLLLILRYIVHNRADRRQNLGDKAIIIDGRSHLQVRNSFRPAFNALYLEFERMNEHCLFAFQVQCRILWITLSKGLQYHYHFEQYYYIL